MDADRIGVIETVLNASGVVSGLAIVAVAIVARRKADSLRGGVPYIALGFFFGLLACISIEGLMLIGAPEGGVRIALPVLLLGASVLGGFGAIVVFASIRSSLKLRELRKERKETLSKSGERSSE